MIKIFHTGDVHLDSQFRRLSHTERMSARQRQRDTFEKMMRYAGENSFDIVLISGDLFDTPHVSPEAEECVIRAFSALSCPVVIAPGNHDPYMLTAPYLKNKLPENVYVFSSAELQVYRFDELGLQVCGYAFTTSNVYESNPLESFELPEFDGVSVLCAHGETGDRFSRFAPLSETEIERCGFTYAALGHIHEVGRIFEGERCTVAYCGCPEGRAFDELDFGGARAVVIDNGKVTSAERVIFAEQRYMWDTLDVSGVSDTPSLIDSVIQHAASKGYGRETSLRLTLTGEVDMSFTPDLRAAQRALEKILSYAELEDETFPAIDMTRLDGDPTLRGEIYKRLRPELESEDRDVRKIALRALKVALLATYGREIK